MVNECRELEELVQDVGNAAKIAHLVSNLPRHVSLRPFQRPERLPKVELYVISLTLHTDT